MKPTIKDVARESEVSVATVSRILNNLGGYSEETRKRVMQVIAELGYHRNEIARGLITKSTNTVGVLIPYVAVEFYSEILNGIEDMASKSGFGVFLCNTGVNGEKITNYIKMLCERQVDAIIIVSVKITDECYELIKSFKKPCILVSSIAYKYKLPYIKVDDYQAAYSATQYLIDKGHTKIALISGDEDDVISGIPRVNGYKAALNDYGLKIDKDIITYGDFEYQSGIECMKKLLQFRDKFTAIFATSDDMAVGAMNYMHKLKIKIPDEFSLIGYDNTSSAQRSYPLLTTVAQPLYKMGEKAMEKIIDMIKNGSVTESIIMPHKIVERDTVKILK